MRCGQGVTRGSHFEPLTGKTKTNCCCVPGRSRAAGSESAARRPVPHLATRPGGGRPAVPHRDASGHRGMSRDTLGHRGMSRHSPGPERSRGAVRGRPLASAAACPRRPRRAALRGVRRAPHSRAKVSITLPRYVECSRCRKLQYPPIALVFISPGSLVPGIPLDRSPLQFQECCLCCH